MTLVGTTLRNIRILEALGEGGMGEVYVGLDERLGRRVAVKAVRPERRMDGRAKARFLREARILSQLEHPNICRIYDFIEDDGADYIVLELVQGTDLSRVAGSKLSFPDKLEIAEQVARALVAAHSMSVIHRDLKPENVMVDGLGQVKVLDFGLARSTTGLGEADELARTGANPGVAAAPEGGATLTALGDVMGTPRYMSPEQARGEPLTAASDMYSFGLVLQELFTGDKPYPVALPFPELRQKAMWGETLPVTGVDAQLTDLIGRLKSFAPRDRPSAVETAERLRWLRERPRRRLRRIAVAAVAGGLIVAAAAATLGWWHARRSLALARAAEAEAAREAATAREVSDFLVGVFSVSDPSESRGNSVTAREILDAASARIEHELGEQPLTQARLMDTMGVVYLGLGLYEPASKLLESAVEVRHRVLAGDDPDLATSLVHLAELEYTLGNYDRTEQLAQSALAIRERRLGPDHADIAPCLNILASVAFSRSDYEGAAALFRRTVAITEAADSPDPADRAEALHNLSVTLRILNQLEEARGCATRALAVTEAASGPDHPAAAALHGELAAILSASGEYESAGEHLKRALSIQEKVLGPDHLEVAGVLRQLAFSHSVRGEFEPAEALLQRSLEIIRTKVGSQHYLAAWSTYDLAVIRHSMGDFAGAERLFSQALETYRATVGPNHTGSAQCLRELALVAHDTGRLERAEELNREALDLMVAAVGRDSVGGALGEARLARVLVKRGSILEAKALYKHAREFNTAILAANPRDLPTRGILASTLVGLGEIASLEGDEESARQSWTEAVEVTEPLASGFALLRAQEYRVKALLLLGRVDEARPTAEALLAVGWSDPDLRKLCLRRGISGGTALRG